MCHKEVGNSRSGRQTARGRCARASTRSWASGEGARGGGGHRRAGPPWVEQWRHWGGWQCVWSAKRAPQAQQAIRSRV